MNRSQSRTGAAGCLSFFSRLACVQGGPFCRIAHGLWGYRIFTMEILPVRTRLLLLLIFIDNVSCHLSPLSFLSLHQTIRCRRVVQIRIKKWELSFVSSPLVAPISSPPLSMWSRELSIRVSIPSDPMISAYGESLRGRRKTRESLLDSSFVYIHDAASSSVLLSFRCTYSPL